MSFGIDSLLEGRGADPAGLDPGRGGGAAARMNLLVFDIETIPDCAGIRRLHDLPASLPDAEVAEVAFQKRRAQTGSDFLPPHLQRVVVISCVLREGEELKYLLQAAELNIMMRRAAKARGYIRRVLELDPQHQRAAQLQTMVF